MDSAADFDFFEDRYPKRTRKPINKPDAIDELEDEVFFQKQKLMSHCVYDIREIVESSEFKDDMVLKMPSASGFDMEYIQKHGLSTPMLFDVPVQELGMIMPDANTFTVFDVLELVGKERKIEVVEVNEQKGRTMKLTDFVKYYTCSPEFRRELLNVLSLEFSMTNLAKQVKPPSFVADIDWIDNVWPRELFERQKVHMQTNQLSDFSTYPKVQRYCLMSVANCFTDFHIDFGGTSVWYHVLKGKKIFWLIEPTEENLLLYEEWIMGGNNSESFFGRIVNKCNRVELTPGMTFIIPSGWIHCVFTPEDSLVFGGNFLHSYSIGMQIRVVRSEDKIRVGSKYRFPHFKQMIWYVIENVVRKATGRIYLRPIRSKAYLADLHVQVLPTDGGDDEEAIDDQEPCCSSAIEAGCKKAGIIKENKPSNLVVKLPETTFSNMGMEESDSDEDSDTSSHVKDPNVCYDDIPNGGDCNLLVPTQLKYGSKNNEKFTPVSTYDEEYLASISATEKNGYFALMEYVKKLIKTKKPEVGEGITRPKHLLLEFENLLCHIGETGILEVKIECDVKRSTDRVVHRKMKTNLDVPLPVVETVFATFKESSKKRNKRKLIKNEDMKTTPKTGKLSKRNSDANNSVLVDGLPHPLQSDEPPPPNPYGYNPLETIVALGQKPLPSAYRKSANMAKLPPVQRFRLKNELNDSATSLKLEDTSQLSVDSAPTPVRASKKEKKPIMIPTPIIKIHRLSSTAATFNAAATSGAAAAELTYKSPLQRLQQNEKQLKIEEEKQRRAHEDRQRHFYEERQRRIEDERRRRMVEEERQRADSERQRQSAEASATGSDDVISLTQSQQTSPNVSAFSSSDLGSRNGLGSANHFPSSYSSVSAGPGFRANKGVGSGSGFGLDRRFGSTRSGDHGFGRDNGSGFSSEAQFNTILSGSDGRPAGVHSFGGRGGVDQRRGRGGGSHFGEYSRPAVGGNRRPNHCNESRFGGGFQGRDRFNGSGQHGDYRRGSHRNDTYNNKGYNNNNHYNKNSRSQRGGGGQWNNINNFGNHGGRGNYHGQNYHQSASAYPQPPFSPFPPVMPGQALPSNEMLAQMGMPPIPDAYRQFGMPLGIPPMSMAASGFSQSVAGINYIQTPRSAMVAAARQYAANRNNDGGDSVAVPAVLSDSNVSDRSAASSNAHYFASASTNQEAMDKESPALPSVSAQPPSYNNRVADPRITDPRANSNHYTNIVHQQQVPHRPSPHPTNHHAAGSTMVDGFEGIDEIGRLTKMMSAEEDEDVDLREPTFYSKFDTHRSISDAAESASVSSINDRADTSTGDPSMDIDKIYLLTQMYTS